LLIDSTVTKDIYDLKSHEFKNRQADITMQIANHTGTDENFHITVSAVLNMAKNALSLFESSETFEKRAILNLLLQNSTVNGKKPEFTMRSPFNQILKLAINQWGSPDQACLELFDWQAIKTQMDNVQSLTGNLTLGISLKRTSLPNKK
jgi:hypothetical protein